MTNPLKQLKMMFFSVPKRNYFDINQSLYDNFINLCSLPFPKTRSAETIRLMNIVKLCQLSTVDNKTLTREKIRHDLALLTLISLAIQHWKIKRAAVSTRTTLINQFLSSIEAQKNSLAYQDQQLFLQQPKSIRPIAWKNPLLDENKLKFSLSPDLRKEFNLLQQVNEPLSHKKYSAYSFVILPFINYIMSFHCVDCLFDVCNLCLDCSKML